MDEKLKNAAMEGDVKFLEKVDAPDEYFKCLYTPKKPWRDQGGNMLHFAIKNKRVEFLGKALEKLPKYVVRFLLCQQAYDKETPLHVAVRSKYYKILKVILEYDEKSLLISSSSSSTTTTTTHNPWLVRDKRGWTPLYYMIYNCREECALKLLAIHPELFSQIQVDHKSDNPFLVALERGFNKVAIMFLQNAHVSSSWASNKEILATALALAPQCSDDVFQLVVQENLRVIKDITSTCVLSMWLHIRKVYPFEYIMKSTNNNAPSLRRCIIAEMISEQPLHTLATYGPEENCIQIARILVDTLKQELDSSQFTTLWFAKDRFGRTPLRVAVAVNHENFALYLLSLEEAHLFLREDDQILFLSIEENCPKVAEKILDMVAEHKLTQLLISDTESTVLHEAPKCTEYFLRRLLEVYPELMEQCDEDGVSVLHSWMKMGKLWAFKYVLEEVDVDFMLRKIFRWTISLPDNQGQTPLCHAAMFGNEVDMLECVKMVLQSRDGFDGWDDVGVSTLIKTLSNKREKLALCFLSHRLVRKYMLLHVGQDILFKATDYNCQQVVEHLLKLAYQDHDSRWLLRSSGQTILHIGAKCSEENCAFMVENFPELINEKDKDGKTPLEKASEVGATWLVELILKKNRSSIEKAPNAWVEACENSHLSTVLAFIDKSPYLRYLCRKHEDTPLHHIKGLTYSEYQELLERPLMKELKNLRNSDGKTPLHKAIENQDKDFGELLLTMSDIDRSVKDKQGNTAMDLLRDICGQSQEWKQMCQMIDVDPDSRTSYIRPNTNLTVMQNTISLVAALLATITFTAGFTLPGGFNNDNGEAILAKKAAFSVFLIANAYAMCSSMLVLFCVIWSMVADGEMPRLLIDRSLVLLKQSLYGTLLAFMTGVYTVIHQKSLWAAIIIFFMCTLVIILASRRVLYKFIPNIPAADDDYQILHIWCFWKREKKKTAPPNSGGGSELEEITTPIQ